MAANGRKAARRAPGESGGAGRTRSEAAHRAILQAILRLALRGTAPLAGVAR